MNHDYDPSAAYQSEQACIAFDATEEAEWFGINNDQPSQSERFGTDPLTFIIILGGVGIATVLTGSVFYLRQRR